MDKIFETLPLLGLYHQECKKFDDKELYEQQYRKFMRLVKVKLWYGTTTGSKENISQNKYILGIQCDYQNTLNGEKKKTEMHCGTLNSYDIITKELELNEGDYICKFYICFNDIIQYIKFVSKKEKILEVGNFDKSCSKTIKFNLDESPHMIKHFYGYYNEYGLRALGCIHLKRKNYYFLNLIDVFRYRHVLKTNSIEKKKWDDKKINKLGYFEKAFLKFCLLPDAQFFYVVQFCC